MKVHFRSNVMKAACLAILCMSMKEASGQDQPAVAVKDDVKALSLKPTPKTADGHPDMTGRWVRLNGGLANSGSGVEGNVHILSFGTPIPGANPETDAVLTNLGDSQAGRKAKEAINKPAYKPEFQAKVEAMGIDINHYDPTTYSCLPGGVPRMGAPSYIVQTPGKVIFLYVGYSEGGGNTARPYSTYRMIPTDGRGHRKDADGTPYGDPVGHWEGDTLVIDTTKFDDSTWFGAYGYFHTDAMRVTERFTRKGDTLQYSATVEDPNVLTKPFNLYPVPVTLKTGDPQEILFNDDNPCDNSNPAHDFRQHADHEHAAYTAAPTN